MTNLQSFKSLQANGFGKNFEKLIDLACKYYRAEGKADIAKIDEPFRVIRLKKAGRFEGQFTKMLIQILRELLMVVGRFVLRQSILRQTE